MSRQRIHYLDPTILAVCCGALSVALSSFPLNFGIFSFLVTYFSSFPLFYVGLRWGMRKLTISVMVAFSIFLISAGFHSAIVLFLTMFIPAFLIVYLFLRGMSAGYIISWLTSLAIALFLGVLVFLVSHSVNVMDILREWFTLFADEKTLKSLHGRIVSLIPGISSISWILMCLINASLAQRLVMIGGHSQRPYPLPTDTQLYELWDIPLAICLMLVLTDVPLLVFIGENIALISCVPIYFLGLKVAYTWLRQYDNAKLWLIVIVFMSIFLVWPGIIIVMFGILEPTLHLCRRWTPDNG